MKDELQKAKMAAIEKAVAHLPSGDRYVEVITFGVNAGWDSAVELFTRKHVFWGAGEKDCPSDLRARNGELHTLRCKICGSENPKSLCVQEFAEHVINYSTGCCNLGCCEGESLKEPTKDENNESNGANDHSV